MIQSFISELELGLNEMLPGSSAHQYVMKDRFPVKELSHELENARKSAVLIHLFPVENVLHTVFIKRPTYKGVHSGQISLPGGKVEEFDKNLMQTAYREAEEEISIDPSKIQHLGQLSQLFIPPSNFLVTPFVAFQNSQPVFKPDKREVDEIIQVPLISLVSKQEYEETTIRIGQVNRMVKGFYLDDNLVWGATAMIIREFLEVLLKLKSTSDLK